jgi:hypothetical protein
MHEPVCSSQLEPLSIQNATTSRPQQRDSVSALSRHRANVGPTDHMRLRPRPYCGDMRSRLRKSLAVPGCAKRVLTRQLYHGAPPRRRIQRLNQSICSSEVAALPSRKSRVRSPPVELPYHMTRSQLRSAKGHQWYKSSHRRLSRPQFTPTPHSLSHRHSTSPDLLIMFAAALAVLATAASVLGAGCPAGQVGVGEILVCPGLRACARRRHCLR